MYVPEVLCTTLSHWSQCCSYPKKKGPMFGFRATVLVTQYYPDLSGKGWWDVFSWLTPNVPMSSLAVCFGALGSCCGVHASFASTSASSTVSICARVSWVAFWKPSHGTELHCTIPWAVKLQRSYLLFLALFLVFSVSGHEIKFIYCQTLLSSLALVAWTPTLSGHSSLLKCKIQYQ